MKKYLLGLVVACTLAGCQQVSTAISAYNYLQGVTITQDQLDVAVAAYDVAVLTPYNTYRYSDAGFTTPRRYCTKTEPFSLDKPCASYDVLDKLRPYISKAESSRMKLQECVSSHCSGVQALATTFKDAWNSAQKEITAEVKKVQ